MRTGPSIAIVHPRAAAEPFGTKEKSAVYVRFNCLGRALALAGLFVFWLAGGAHAGQAAAGSVSDRAAVQAAPILKPWTGDLDGMVKRRAIRAGVFYSKTHYFVDRGVQRGISYEGMKLYEDELNKSLGTGHMKVHVVFVVLTPDELGAALRDGRIDVIAVPIVVTPERQALGRFTVPTRTNVREIVVTAPGAPVPASLDDLSGRDVFVRKSSDYYTSLMALNADLAKRGKPPVNIKVAPEALADEDILEMLDAGLVATTLMHDHLVTYWKQVFPHIVPHADLAVRAGAELALATRTDSVKLGESLDGFIKRNGPRTMFGNVLAKRYLVSTKYTKSATAEAEIARFKAMVAYFRKYGSQYDLDWLLMAAQGFQESGLNQDVHSQVGAVGVMQVMPATGKDLNVGDIGEVEANIHAGIKYMRFMMNQYYKDEPMDPLNKALMTFASYNAGPGRIRQLRRETARRGLDQNVWFNNVEQIVSEKIGRETVQYVSNIYKYYVAYTLAWEATQQKVAEKGATH